MKTFNNAGPSVQEMHYMINPLDRIDLSTIESLIAEWRYFVLHAPRQTGKTTSLLALMQYLNEQGKYRALYVNIEGAQAARGDVGRGMTAITSALADAAAYYLRDERLRLWRTEMLPITGYEDLLRSLLARWSEADPRPVVLMLDEVDALVGDTLISLLRQIRAGYAQRPVAFPQTVILCGVRDVRDYRIHTSHNEIITGGSAFNIKAKSLRLGNFSQEETEALWRQHETDTGQKIDPAIYPELWEDTAGQPWLVNALGYEVASEDRELRNRTQPITLERYKAARERLIQSRATHLDQLTDKLREERVRRVVSALLDGESMMAPIATDDLQYVEDMGLIKSRPKLAITNRIYQEIIPRELTWTTQVTLNTHDQPWYVREDRRLDMPKLIAAFQQFFREHSEAWLERFEYKEAGPHLLMQAFLQRIVNGGGRINREYGLGRGRTDLFLEWPLDETQGYNGPVQRVVIELKLLRKAPETTLSQGIVQTLEYADRCGADEAHLILFDRRPKISWNKRIWHKKVCHEDRTVFAWGA
ncbi:MAG: AAA-like domain-containing protein [Rhodocyclaceae bacterium]|nr:AAA-like domain-containing protein [Rhodocyclaceae bacterium]